MKKTSIIEAVFDASSIQWGKDSNYNRMFLVCQENYFNHLLVARGHVFLNEVFDALGMNRTSRGQLDGWWYEPGMFIDFHIPKEAFASSTTLSFHVFSDIYKELDK